MPPQIKKMSLTLMAACLFPSIALAESNFSYDFYEVGISSTTGDDDSYTSLSGNGSMEINNDHYITAHIKSDIANNVTANEIGVGIGAYKASSEQTDYYSRAGIKHGKALGGSQQTLSVGFGARHQMSDTIELQGGIDLLFSTAEEGSGVSGNITALYEINETMQLGGTVETDGDTAETRVFTRVKML